MAEWMPLAVCLITAALLLAALAVVLRTPMRLTDARCRLAELEVRVAAQESSVKKALRRAGIAAKKQATPEPEPEPTGLEELLAGPPTGRHDGGWTLDEVNRLIAMRRGARHA